MQLRRAAGLAIAASVAGCSAADLVDDARPSATSSAIVHGAVTTADPAVVALVPRRLHCGSGPIISFCSGALIAPRVVLTAAHCLEAKRAGELRVFFGDDVTQPGAFADVTVVSTHPLYDPSTQAWDLGLLRLAHDAPVAPMRASRTPLDALLVGKSVRAVGFGLDEAGRSGVKRTGSALVSELAADTFRITPGPAMTCGGDSGGPVLRDDGGGETIVGVTRSGDAACAEYGTVTRIDVDAFVDSLEAVPDPPSPALDPTRDACSVACATDADCPREMLCLNERSAGRRCGYPTLQSGRFAQAGANDAECGEGACVFLNDGDCRCYQPCPAPAVDAGPNAPAHAYGGGCSAAPSRSRWADDAVWMALLLAILWIARTRSQRDLRSTSERSSDL